MTYANWVRPGNEAVSQKPSERGQKVASEEVCYSRKGDSRMACVIFSIIQRHIFWLHHWPSVIESVEFLC